MAETQRVLVQAEVEDKVGDVCTQGREPTLQGGVCPQAKLKEGYRSSQSAQWDDYQKPL